MDKFQRVINKLSKLKSYPFYTAALIFGSLASRTFDESSDIDLMLITDKDRKFSILHPYIENIKLDLSYRSFRQLKAETDSQIEKGLRRPMIAGCNILFDKTGELSKYIKYVNSIVPPKISKDKIKEIMFMIHHSTNKIERNISSDPQTAMLVMHTSLDELLKNHYLVQERWFVSSKKIFKDLKVWDPFFAKMIENYLLENNIINKFVIWNKMTSYVLKPIGGLKSLDSDIDSEFKEDINIILNL